MFSIGSLLNNKLIYGHDNDYWHDDDGIVTWYDDYQKHKAQKAKIKEELMPIAWHPDHVMDWCMSENEKG